MRNIFDKTTIGSMVLTNRFFRTACGDSYGKNGHISKEDIGLYKKLSLGNMGAIITGYTYISDYGMSEDIGMFGIYDDTFIDEYKALTQTVHNNNSKIILQLVHLGSATLMKNFRVIAPSVIENSMTKTVPEEMTTEEIHRIEDDFVKAAIRAKKAGFDGVEIHAAHNFLVNQFTSPHYNHRKDEYGGSVENRARFISEVVKSMREELGNNFPILLKMQSEETFEDGITSDDFISICKIVEVSGASALEVSGPWMTYKQKEPYFETNAKRLSDEVSIPVILTGGIRSIETANRIMGDTNIQYIGMCRPFINNPNLIKEWKNGDNTASKCVSCGACSRTHICVLNK